MTHHHPIHHPTPNPFDHEVHARAARATVSREMWSALRARLLGRPTRPRA